MKVLKTEHSWKNGQTNVIPFLGATQISIDGTIEVQDDEVADKLVELEIGWNIVGKSEVTTTTTTELVVTTTTTVEEGTTTTTTQLEEFTTTTTTLSEKELLFQSLDNMTVSELQEQAAPFPSAEWKTLNKKPLLEYLKSKLN